VEIVGFEPRFNPPSKLQTRKVKLLLTLVFAE
jgi:hypothetical protein